MLHVAHLHQPSTNRGTYNPRGTVEDCIQIFAIRQPGRAGRAGPATPGGSGTDEPHLEPNSRDVMVAAEGLVHFTTVTRISSFSSMSNSINGGVRLDTT